MVYCSGENAHLTASILGGNGPLTTDHALASDFLINLLSTFLSVSLVL